MRTKIRPQRWSFDIKVVLRDPAVGDLKMPAVELLVADRRHDARRLSGFQDDDDLIRLGCLEVRVDEFVAPALWRLDIRGGLIPSREQSRIRSSSS